MMKVKQEIKPTGESAEFPRPAHTPLPWRVDGDDDDYAAIDICEAGGAPVAMVYNVDAFPCLVEEQLESVNLEAHANAEFIVRAVNAHDALVRVKDAAQQVLSDFPQGVPAHWNELRAALALASDTQEAKEDKYDEGK